ncbi:arylsulfatase [Gimesia sp.]|uniref:arylsulfatase n=1 Tax=Gimesia sp. TaxID=2024833 RepID=UPI000C39CCD5|nr:arylsulfatase [Gimesia sp.]MAX40372.1 N-acetylgalactosamine-6-sulfatase [Gimesia sp.]HBL43146.1 N-acetylgalactosamine-6-sulfatase [Planctomycetaceae bacterium]
MNYLISPRRLLCLITGVFIISLALLRVAHAAETPNIIYVMADDLGYGDLGCYGQEVIQTPNIDQLAKEGMLFTNHYAGHTVCRPSRLVLLTGQHSGHTPISQNEQYHFPAGTTTVTSLLKDAGYTTGGVGKWALGPHRTSGVPSRQGFDFWFGYLDQGNAHNYYPEFLWRNEQKVVLPGNQVGPQKRVSLARETYSHDLLTEEAFQFIRQNSQRPFFLQAHYTIPHANNEGGRAVGDGMEVPEYGIYANRDWPAPEKGFAAMITRLDRDLGSLVALLKELKLDDNTIIFFTSDNGPHQEGKHQVEFFNSNGPLRGFKRDLYEGGIRVPLIAKWPGKIKPGTSTDHISAFWDFLPTACDLAGIESPQNIDGISYLPTLLGKPQPTHETLFWKYRGKEALRAGKWKAVRSSPQKPLELYDLETDIGEQHNLADQHPKITARMQQQIKASQNSD